MDDVTQSGFRLLLLDLLGMPDGSVRPADINQPTEGEEYAIVQFTSSDPQGFGGAVFDPDDIDAGQREQLAQVGVTVDFFGQRAGQLAQRLPLVLSHDHATDRLDAIGLALIDVSGSRDLTPLEQDRIQRYQVRVELLHIEQHTSPVPTGHIESFTIGFTAEQI